jgi:O-acetyl-ADP-ribose deacetylase (regulator of RNase III)
MALSILVGDLFASGVDILVCPTNTVGVMGAGLALQFRQRFPGLDTAYNGACRRGEHDAMHPFVWQHGGPIVVCLATKRHWRDPSRLEDVEACIRALAAWLAGEPRHRVAVPPLGCGLGGLRFDDVFPILQRHLAGVPHDVFVYAPPLL